MPYLPESNTHIFFKPGVTCALELRCERCFQNHLNLHTVRLQKVQYYKPFDASKPSAVAVIG